MSGGGGPDGAPARGRLLQGATGAGLLALVVLVVATGGVWRPASWSAPAFSASFFPMLALGGLGLCAVLIALGADRGEVGEFGGRDVLRMLGTLGGIGAFALLLPVLGWVPASLALLVAMPLLTGYRRLLPLAVFVAATVALTWLVFGLLVRIPLAAFP